MTPELKLEALPPTGFLIPVRPGARIRENSPKTSGNDSAPVIPRTATEKFGTTRHRDLHHLASISFDAFWEARRVGEGVHVLSFPLRDMSAELGMPDGSLETFIQEEWFSGICPEDQPIYLLSVQKALETSGDFNAEYRSIHRDGSTVWWEDTGRPVEMEDGLAVRWFGIVRNITERREREEKVHAALKELQALKARLESEVNALREEVTGSRAEISIVGRNPAFHQVLRQAELVGQTETSAMITGETGTGKTLIAKTIHRMSRRRQEPLVTVNCAALPASLIESEIFGHEKGAFTGATSQRPGRFEIADGGTLFLDEIGELPLDTQAKLLRVLETGEYERVGSSQIRKADVRLIAATNRDLRALCDAGRFRNDLYFRLNVFPIHVPPLRDRRGDIPLLAAYILERKCSELGRELRNFDPDQIERLCAYAWPGNIRELENVIERAVILSHKGVLPLELQPKAEPELLTHAGSPPEAEIPEGFSSLNEMERAHILAACESTNWKIKGADGAAARLGLTPGTLYFRMKKHGIQRPEKNGRRASSPTSDPAAP